MHNAARNLENKPLPTRSIGNALKQLKVDFPDVTVSKIRFLESEGLVTPQRAASGYRRYSQDDIDRLRFILTQQQTHYLPLKVIKKQLEGIDSGEISMVQPQDAQMHDLAGSTRRYTSADFAEETGVSELFLKELVDIDLIQTVHGGFYLGEQIPLVKMAASLAEHGVESRYIKNLVTFGKRQADWVKQVTRGASFAKDEGAAARKEEIQKEVASLTAALTSEVLKENL